MLESTPEYVAAYLSELADHPPKVSPDSIARFRAERRRARRAKIGRLVASISRVFPSGRAGSGDEVAPIEPDLAG